MRWRGRRQSDNLVFARGGGRGGAIGGGGIVVLLIAMGLYWMLGGNPLALLTQVDPAVLTGPDGQPVQPSQASDFAAVVLADTEDVWHALFRQVGRTYVEPTMTIYSGQVRSGCGFTSAQVGPFYCPADRTVYLDLDFLQQLQRELGAGGDFAQAYIIAHEVGHHVQHLLGAMDQVQSQRGRISEREYNDLSVRLELQADFYAGVWAHHAQRTKDVLEPGDLEEAIRAAGAVGDDRLQQRSQGRVVPDSFTHGTSAQRVRWFRRGWETGDPAQGDTFHADDL